MTELEKINARLDLQVAEMQLKDIKRAVAETDEASKKLSTVFDILCSIDTNVAATLAEILPKINELEIACYKLVNKCTAEVCKARKDLQ